jgi:hypothetical protein
MPSNWAEIILEAGREGKHITHFLCGLGISWEGHHALLKRNTVYSETFKEYQKLSEQWWFERAHEAIASGQSNKFNQRLWTIIMKNKFRDSWSDEKQIDITSAGDKINDNSFIQVEIIKKDNLG